MAYRVSNRMEHKTNYKYVDFGTTTVFAHLIVTNKPEDEQELDTYGIWEHPNGQTTYYNGAWEMEIGEEVYYAWQYRTGDEIPPLIKGTYTVTIFNAKNDERLGGGSICVE